MFKLLLLIIIIITPYIETPEAVEPLESPTVEPVEPPALALVESPTPRRSARTRRVSQHLKDYIT